LFNALLEEDRAIVTPFPGTTRDFLRENLVIDDIVFHLVDMAGLGRPAHPVERTGIARGKRIAHEADGLIVVLDASRRLGAEDERLIRKYREKKIIVVLNKIDLPGKIDRRKARALAGANPVAEISALKGRRIDALRREIRAVFAPGAGEEEVVLHARQRDRLQSTVEALKRAEGLIEKGQSEEIYAEEIRTALVLVGELTGEVRVDEILQEVFARFCVGK
jgi:tRNA modification GTPase